MASTLRNCANVNEGRQLSTSELETLTFPMQSCSDYKFEENCRTSGSFGLVFKGVDLRNGKDVVMKEFHIEGNRKSMINREILCLQKLENGTNIIPLLAVIKKPSSEYPSLIFEYVCTEFEEVYFTLNESETRFYLKELLKALNFCHCKGIMHRDLKPTNILIDREKQILRLIDFGASEFYFPGSTYENTGTQIYQPPEVLLINNSEDIWFWGAEVDQSPQLQPTINYSVDMWSFGVILAEMQFKKHPFFPQPVMFNILSVLGNNNWNRFISGNVEPTEPDDHIPFENFVKKNATVSPQAIDFIKSLLVYDPSARLTAEEAMAHDFFG